MTCLTKIGKLLVNGNTLKILLEIRHNETIKGKFPTRYNRRNINRRQYINMKINTDKRINADRRQETE